MVLAGGHSPTPPCRVSDAGGLIEGANVSLLVRRTFLADQPMTAVAAFCATQAEREMAVSAYEAERIVAKVGSEARVGNSGALVDLYRLVFSDATFDFSARSAQFLTGRLSRAVREGRLLLVRGWAGTSGYPGGRRERAPDPHSQASRLAETIMSDRDHLPLDGVNYVVIPANGWRALRDTGRYQVLHKEEAGAILNRLAAHSATDDQKAALEEAEKHLAHTHVRTTGKGLFVARQVTAQAVSRSAVQPTPAVTPSQRVVAMASPAAAPGPSTGHLVVRVRTPLGAAIAGVTVEVAGLTHRSTAGDGQADFGAVPPGAYSARAHKADYGPVPPGGAVFAIGEATGSQTVAAGATATIDLVMATVTSVVVSHTPVIAATPLRIYKQAPGDAHVDHVVTCTALCPRTTGTGAGTQIPVRVDWTFTPAPPARMPIRPRGARATPTYTSDPPPA